MGTVPLVIYRVTAWVILECLSDPLRYLARLVMVCWLADLLENSVFRLLTPVNPLGATVAY